MTTQTPNTPLALKAAAHDAQVAHERLVQRCKDEAGQSGITRLRVRRDDAARARVAAENALMRGGEHD